MYEKREHGYIHECYIELVDGDDGPLFEVVDNEYLVCKLINYAIIPMEEYRRLIKLELEA